MDDADTLRQEAIASQTAREREMREKVEGEKPGIRPVAVGPAGIPVSQALSLDKVPKTGKVGLDIREVLNSIDDIHGDGDLPDIPIKLSSSSKRSGQLRIERDILGGKSSALDISVSRRGEHTRITTAHEVGHFLDRFGVGDSGRSAASERYWGEGREALAEALGNWKVAVNNSDAAQGLMELYRSDEMITVDVNIGTDQYPVMKPIEYGIDKEYIRYLGQPEEMFARSYSQYIATRSQDPLMLAELESMRVRGDRFYYPQQWEDDDFEPIADSFDGLFRVLGWLK